MTFFSPALTAFVLSCNPSLASHLSDQQQRYINKPLSASKLRVAPVLVANADLVSFFFCHLLDA